MYEEYNSHVSMGQEIFIPSLESGFSKPNKKESWEKILWVLGAPLLGIRRTLERMIRGLKVPGMLKFVTIFFLVPWLSAIIAEIRGILVLFRGLHFLELKTKNFSSLSFRRLIWGA